MAKYERPSTKIKNEVSAAEITPVIQTDVVENIVGKDNKFVKFDQANAHTKGHNFKDQIVEVKKGNPFVTTVKSNASLTFFLNSINFLSQRISQEEVGKKVAEFVGGSLVTKCYLMDDKDDQKVLAVLNKSIVINYFPTVKTSLDRCKTGEEFKINKDRIAPELIALMKDDCHSVSQYGDDLVVVLDPTKVIEMAVIPFQLTTSSPDTLGLIKLSNVRIARKQIFFAIKTEGALSSENAIFINEGNFVTCDLNVPYDTFLSMSKEIWTHLGITDKEKAPVVKYFDVLKIVGADIKESPVRRAMLGINDAPVSKAPIVKLDPSYKLAYKKTGNPMLDRIYAQQSKITQVETKFDTDKIMKDFGFLLNGEVHTYAVGNDSYLLVDTKKLFAAVMFRDFYNSKVNNFKFKLTVNPDVTYGIGCTMSI